MFPVFFAEQRMVGVVIFRKYLFLIFSLGVALSRGHGKFFFRGNVTVEEGRTSALIRSYSFTHFYSFIVLVRLFLTQLERITQLQWWLSADTSRRKKLEIRNITL